MIKMDLLEISKDLKIMKIKLKEKDLPVIDVNLHLVPFMFQYSGNGFEVK